MVSAHEDPADWCRVLHWAEKRLADGMAWGDGDRALRAFRQDVTVVRQAYTDSFRRMYGRNPVAGECCCREAARSAC